ncbi:MAG TPA: hypothetical protein VH025_05890 [Solirubrobacteraceae bacterium]|jgi:hypothetical protein|nr:hypothetical protein [Solirubrobacteraceae bacterium]
MRALTAGACLILCLAGLAGCGGGSSSGSGSGDTSASAEFESKGNAVCTEIAAIGKKLKAPKSASEFHPFLSKAVSIGREEVEKLRALTPPSDKQAAFNRYLSGISSALLVLQHADAAAQAGKVSEITSILEKAQGLEGRNIANARAAGLTACASAEAE